MRGNPRWWGRFLRDPGFLESLRIRAPKNLLMR
jgi:hypothetical protein